MKALLNTSPCNRADDLVAYLYGETSETQALDFVSHTHECASCRDELAAFGQVRESVGEWRELLLRPFESPAFETSAPLAVETLSTPRRSPLAALREFFALSPLWMRAATAAAAIVICALVVIGITRLVEQPKIITVEKLVTVESAPSEEEIRTEIEKRVREELATRQKEGQDQAEPVPVKTEQKLSTVQPGAAKASNVMAGNKRTQPVAQPSRKELQLIAEDVQLVTKKDEDDLPSLYNLVDDESN